MPSLPFCRRGPLSRVPVHRATLSVFRYLVLKAQEYLGVVIKDRVDILGRQA
jgi:hypothetical protein